jgi:hypothetical protein
MGRIKAETLSSYVSAIRSCHVDKQLPTATFDSPVIKRLLAGALSLSPPTKRARLPITRDILSKIVTAGISKKYRNLDAAFTLAFAGFLRMGEITYTTKERKAPSFSAIKVTRSDIQFSSNLDHMLLRLKRSKTDSEHHGVSITIAATGDDLCPVQAMKRLFDEDRKDPLSPLFSLDGGAFSAAAVQALLVKRLTAANVLAKGYSGHSFRKGAAQHAKDHGFTDSQIQQLGRWTSNAFRLYCEASAADLFRLNAQFQRGTPLAFIKQT